ncbi:urease accessory protein UreD [Rivularia sp. UHCC 0363]|uniref:urease accessory protein UreD n=1 Tax=Rivularia sp. UHCC 0363 TaxID=3110244 RepID=UPI002B21C004|nr:urease accessory protein UreD [Rivularia sp. UHCC 0363]MEA5595273.1 urease accessory protein UreD [Rivularia sp. UHCC 0363]
MQQPCRQPESSQSWHGKLNLVYNHSQDKTTLIQTQNQAPLKVQRPFYPEGQSVCHSVILHTAGGIVGGDKLSCNFHLQPYAKALITTAAANKIYRSNGLQARQNIDIKIDNHACLEWLPQETIVFNDANYRQDIRIILATDASFIGWEITRFGRSASCEKFVKGEWRSHFEIWQNNKPLWIDRQYLPGSEEIFHSPHALAGKPIVGTLVYLGKPVSPEIVQQARNFIPPSSSPPLSPSSFGVTRLENGLLCRYRGDSTTEVRNWFISVWQLLRISFLNRDRCLPRVWML